MSLNCGVYDVHIPSTNMHSVWWCLQMSVFEWCNDAVNDDYRSHHMLDGRKKMECNRVGFTSFSLDLHEKLVLSMAVCASFLWEIPLSLSMGVYHFHAVAVHLRSHNSRLLTAHAIPYGTWWTPCKHTFVGLGVQCLCL